MYWVLGKSDITYLKQIPGQSRAPFCLGVLHRPLNPRDAIPRLHQYFGSRAGWLVTVVMPLPPFPHHAQVLWPTRLLYPPWSVVIHLLVKMFFSNKLVINGYKLTRGQPCLSLRPRSLAPVYFGLRMMFDYSWRDKVNKLNHKMRETGTKCVPVCHSKNSCFYDKCCWKPWFTCQDKFKEKTWQLFVTIDKRAFIRV